MADPAYLAGTLVMGLLGVGVVVLVLRGRRWHHYAPTAAYGMDAGDGRPTSGLSRVANKTSTWTAAYALLVLGFLAGAIITLSGSISGPALIVALVAAIVLYLVGGVYLAMRGNGRPSAQAAAGSAVTLGLLFVLAISAKLVLGL
jgi:cbb3-type cytochrome oxidase subunit 3